jgi:hypothetical protein
VGSSWRSGARPSRDGTDGCHVWFHHILPSYARRAQHVPTWHNQDKLDSVSDPTWKTMLFALAFMHTIVQERRKFHTKSRYG